MTSAVILGMIVTMFPKPGDQARAIGVYSFVASAGGAVGLLLGGRHHPGHQLALDLLRQPADRRSSPASSPLRLLEHEPGLGLRSGADLPGAVLLVSALMLGVYTIVEASHYSWGSAHTLGFGAVSVGAAGRVPRPAGPGGDSR